jgi:hypothetical protein
MYAPRSCLNCRDFIAVLKPRELHKVGPLTQARFKWARRCQSMSWATFRSGSTNSGNSMQFAQAERQKVTLEIFVPTALTCLRRATWVK